MKFSIDAVMRLGLLTLVGMGAVALLINHFSETVDIASMLMGPMSWYWQLLIGTGYGVASGFLANFIISMSFMNPVRLKYESMFAGFDLNISEIWFISFCAGVGEELLFRGAIQPLIGIPITSIVFVAIHGYLNPRDWRISIYGVFMTGIIWIMGIGAEQVGLLSAIVAHMLIDVVLLGALNPNRNNLGA
ncbi:MAG: CPBP family intramembrane glutamic endopeptidase [Flavobacteriales bacterium]|jgi:membrane protease YdiL (CAAX protease family)